MGQVLQFPTSPKIPKGRIPAVQIQVSLSDAGVPALFLQLPSFEQLEGVAYLKVEELKKPLKKLNLLIIHGDDPLQYQPMLEGLLTQFRPGLEVELVTHGGFEPTDDFDFLIWRYRIYPNLDRLTDRTYENSLGYFAHSSLSARRTFHFNIQIDNITKEMPAIRNFAKTFDLPCDDIFLGAAGSQHMQLNGFRALAEYCVKEGYGFNSNLKILAGVASDAID